jgi:endonuclease/exonuclease/phosphatase family metal-dependent hydrolase
MRITTWNCLSNFARKLPALSLLHDPDIAAIQECSREDISRIKKSGYSGCWMGVPNQLKGHGVIWKKHLSVRRLTSQSNSELHEEWVVPFEISGPINFTFVAIWAQSKSGLRGYVKQIRTAFDAHPEWFQRGDLVVAGDFNSGHRWNAKLAPFNHESLVRFLDGHGLMSAYHSQLESPSNSAEAPTLHWRNKKSAPYHVDYIFIPKTWESQGIDVRLGCHSDWKMLSDHCPLTLALEVKK